MNGLDLFSGIGGISYALRDYVRPVAYCEIDAYCQAVLLSRMDSGEIFNAPIWDDIKTLTFGKHGKVIDIIYGGFPCQGISIAGLGKGLEDERSLLFFEMLRLAREIKPIFVFVENVSFIKKRGGVQVLTEFAKLGYNCRWCSITAKSIGAPHKRERWFMLAYSRREQKRGEKESEWTPNNIAGCFKNWEDTPPIHRMDDGVPQWMDRNKSLGNAVVPEQAKKAFEILMGIDQI